MPGTGPSAVDRTGAAAALRELRLFGSCRHTVYVCQGPSQQKAMGWVAGTR